MNDIQSAAIVVAVVQAIKSFVPEKVTGWITILAAAIIGAGLAYVQSTDIVNGIYVGLASVGAVTVASKIGK